MLLINARLVYGSLITWLSVSLRESHHLASKRAAEKTGTEPPRPPQVTRDICVLSSQHEGSPSSSSPNGLCTTEERCGDRSWERCTQPRWRGCICPTAPEKAHESKPSGPQLIKQSSDYKVGFPVTWTPGKGGQEKHIILSVLIWGKAYFPPLVNRHMAL